MSSEIEEVQEDSNGVSNNRVREASQATDVYVAVGKDDFHVLKWVLDHAISPGARVFLVHVFPPVSYIPTPAGKLSRSQLSQEQVRVYVNEETSRRRNLLEKYIRLCTEAKVAVETMLVESKATSKAILDLIRVVQITYLVMGTKPSPFPRLLGRRESTGEYVQKNAPASCNVTIVYQGNRVTHRQLQQVRGSVSRTLAPNQRPDNSRFSECICFSGKFM